MPEDGKPRSSGVAAGDFMDYLAASRELTDSTRYLVAYRRGAIDHPVFGIISASSLVNTA